MAKLKGSYSFVICGWDDDAKLITSAERTPVYFFDNDTSILLSLNPAPVEGTTHYQVFGTAANQPFGPYLSIRGEVCPRVPASHRYIEVDYADRDLCVEMPVAPPSQTAERFIEQAAA